VRLKTSSAVPFNFAIICLVLVLAACAIKPPPTREEIQQQAGKLAEMNLDQPWRAGDSSSGPIVDDWLATFDDPLLNALVAEAIANNPDLAVAATKVEQAEQYVVQAKAALLPAINVFGTGGFKMGGGDVGSALQGLSLGVSWEPDLWGRLRYGRNAVQASYVSVAADYEFSRQSLAATVARAWFTSSEARLQLQIAGNMVEEQKLLLELAETRWRIGPGNEQEVALARAKQGSFSDAERQV
jgi:outer membrane protein TolC